MDRITSNLPRIKNALHGIQAFCILVAGIMTIVFLVKGDHSGGAIIFYLVLCFLSVPAIVYNSMTLWFERSRAWGNAYVFAILDLLFTILWLAAMSAVAAFNASETAPKADEPAAAVAGSATVATRMLRFIARQDTPAPAEPAPASAEPAPADPAPAPSEPAALVGMCDPACNVAKTMVGFAFFIFFFFALTTAISLQNALYYRAHGSMPLANQRMKPGPQSIDPDRDAFSTAPHDLYAPLGAGHDGADDDEDERMDGREGGYQQHRRASNDLYGSGAGHEGGRYGLPSYHTGASDDGKDAPDHLGRFDHEIGGRASAMGGSAAGRHSAMGGRASAMSHTMPYGPDSYQDTSYGGASAYKAPRVDEELGNGGRVHFPAAPYGA